MCVLVVQAGYTVPGRPLVACIALNSTSMEQIITHGKWCPFVWFHARQVNGTA